MSTPLGQWYEAVLQQMAAEAYFENIALTNPGQVEAALRRGNNRPGFPDDRGFTRFTATQVDEFLGKYQIVAQASDYADPNRSIPVYFVGTNILANTGMSATLIQKRGTNEYTLAIRSTEFRPVVDGGDRDRDATGADLTGIFVNGLALAQLSALEDYFAWLKQSGNLPLGATLNVTGYSLGGHLATVFTEIHASDADIVFGETMTFNGAGRGTWNGASNPGEIVSFYRSVLASPVFAAALVPQLSTPERQVYDAALAAASSNQPLDPLSVYQDPRHAWAQLSARLQFQLQFSPFDQGSADLRNGAAARITQIYGKEFAPEWTGVANSGVHGPATGVFVEAQPLVEQQYVNNGGATDFGNGHALVLLADSLALMRAYQTLDPSLSLERTNALFAASSNRIAQSVPAATAEDDALENALDALRRLFLGSDVLPTEFVPGAKGFGNFDARNDFHNKLDELTTSASYAQWAGQVVIAELAGESVAEILDAAQSDIAYRYAIRELNPFVATEAEALHDAHNSEGQLDLYDPAQADRRGMTASYLADRADMLAFSLRANLENARAISSSAVTDQRQYLDLRTRADGTSASVLVYLVGGTPNFNGPNTRALIFGTSDDDALQGRENRDRLYADAGNDYLRGGPDDDYLEGGSGLDIYDYRASTALGLFDANDGADTIFDSDGRGLLRYTYTPSSGVARGTVVTDASVEISATEWRSADGGFSYVLTPGQTGQSDLVITINGDAGGRITLKDFRDGDFGIQLYQSQPRSFAEPADTILGTDSGESLAGTAEPNVVLAYAGADVVRAGGGDDSVEGGDGADSIFGEGGNDRLYGDAGRDSVYGGSGDDELYGGFDADILEGDDGADRLAGGEGSDVVSGGARADEVHGGEVMPLASALLLSESGAATGLKGDWTEGGAGDDTVVAGEGDDQVMGGGGSDVLVGGAGDDNLVGDREGTAVRLDDWLVTRQVTASGDAITYQVIYNAFAQTVESVDGADDLIYGGAGADWIFGGAGGDFVDGGSGDDVVFGEAGGDALSGGSGNDVLIGDNPGAVAPVDEGGDYLDGGEGDDQLFGNGGDDVLFGGAGRDTLIGGAGRDLYVVSKGDGEDTIYDVASGADDPEASVLVLGEGISQASIRFRTGSLLVDLGDGDQVHVEEFDQVDPAATTVLGAIQFADGTRMSYADVLAQGFDIDGTEGDDDGHDGAHPQLAGTGVADRIHGLGGNDVLFGLAGDDALAGDGGDDTLVGASGDDRYLFSRGAGRDLVFDQDATPANADRVEFAAGIAPEDIDATRDAAYPGNLILTIRGSNDALTIANQYISADWQVEEICFTDGTAWTPATTPLLLRGSAGTDHITGTAGPDAIEALAGNDLLAGGAGDDLYRFARGDGQDTIADYDATAGNSDTILLAADILPAQVQLSRSTNDLVLKLSATTDRITVSNYFLNDGATPYSLERIKLLADGTVWDVDTVKQMVLAGTAAADNLTGYASDDVLAGLGGDDSLAGGAGSDAYLYSAGDGSDTISESANAADADVLRFAAGIAPADVTLKRISGTGVSDLLVDVAPGAARIRIAGQFAGDEPEGAGIERIEFDGGTAWDRAAIRTRLLTATTGDDLLIGYSGDDSVDGLAGNDTLEGAAGNDTLRGGAGNDQVTGGPGDDLFLFNPGDAQDVVSDRYGTGDFPGDGIDTLQLGGGLTPGNVTATRNGNELRIALNGTADLVRLSQYFNDDAIECIQFADGTVWTPATVAAMFPVNGTAGNDTLTGSGLPDTISAMQGSDIVHGGGGNDTIDGGPGYDQLYGDAGDDVIYGGQFDTRKASSDALYGGAGNDVLIATNAYGQSMYGEAGNDIFIGGSGWAWMEDTGGNNLFWAGSGNDDLQMGDGNDAAIGGKGADSIASDRDGDDIRGRDVILYNKGDGNDNVWEVDAASTVSIGGGALYSNLSLEVAATSLKLNVATGSITFQRWYEQAPFALPRVRYLQLVIEGTRNYAPSSSDPMRNRKIQYFDFEGLVADFDAARAAGQSFSVADNLQNHRIWGSDSDAMGGALAYQYARTGSVGALSWDHMRAVIGDAAFGNAAQPLVAPAAAASGSAEGVVLEEASVAIELAMLAAANESLQPKEVLQPQTDGAGRLERTGTSRIAELPAAWFMPKPLPQSAAAHTAAWRRIARELPAHLDHAAAWDGAPPFADGVRVNPQSAIGVRVTFDGGIGLRDPAASPLRNFEGLKEGLSLLA